MITNMSRVWRRVWTILFFLGIIFLVLAFIATTTSNTRIFLIVVGAICLLSGIISWSIYLLRRKRLS